MHKTIDEIMQTYRRALASYSSQRRALSEMKGSLEPAVIGPDWTAVLDSQRYRLDIMAQILGLTKDEVEDYETEAGLREPEPKRPVRI